MELKIAISKTLCK